MYAIVLAGGKQHRVQEGDLIRVEKIEGDVGHSIVLDDVLMVGGPDGAQVGTPRVDGARVEAEIVRHGRAKKILVFKKKRRKNYRRLRGHKQPFTHLVIKEIKVG
ncbi:MAG: 50S ribosomal protein L21 [Myxococcota bacterium]